MEQNSRNDIVHFNMMRSGRPFLNADTTSKSVLVAPHLQFLSIKDVCSRLNIGRSMVYKLIREGKLRSITIGDRRLIPIQALEDLYAQFEAERCCNG